MTKSNVISFVLRAKNRLKILDCLLNGQKISAQIEKQTGMYKSHVCRTLKELQERKLIRCINPKDRNFRFYELTAEGKRVVVQAKELLQKIQKE